MGAFFQDLPRIVCQTLHVSFLAYLGTEARGDQAVIQMEGNGGHLRSFAVPKSAEAPSSTTGMDALDAPARCPRAQHSYSVPVPHGRGSCDVHPRHHAGDDVHNPDCGTVVSGVAISIWMPTEAPPMRLLYCRSVRNGFRIGMDTTLSAKLDSQGVSVLDPRL